MGADGSRGRQFREPAYRPTADRFARHLAEQWGDRDLVVLDDQRLSYRDLETESRRLGRALLASGVRRRNRVALLAPNGPEWVIGWMAAARIGALVVLLSTFHQARELDWALSHCRAEMLLTVDRYLNHDYLARLEQAVPDLADQHREAIAAGSHPSLRAAWIWGEAGTSRSWAGPMDALLDRAGDVQTSSSTRQPTAWSPRIRWWSSTRRAALQSPRARSTRMPR